MTVLIETQTIEMGFNPKSSTMYTAMPVFLLFITTFVSKTSSIPVSRLTSHRKISKDSLSLIDSENALSFLVEFGYLQAKPRPLDKTSVANALAKFQSSYGLPITRRFDRRTLKVMQKPRCGLPDVEPAFGFRSPGDGNHNKSKNLTSLKRRKRFALVSRWPTSHITYGFRSYSQKLSRIQQQNVISQALKVWSDETPLTFSQNWDGDADIMISFERGIHDDGYPFDGPGHTLAHAFYPGQGGRSGDVHFDEDEEWAYRRSDDGTNLFMVAVHEIGHALGLAHSNSSGSVMLPFYQNYHENTRLGVDDTKAIYNLYGAGGDNYMHDYLIDLQPIYPDSPHTATSGEVLVRDMKQQSSTPDVTSNKNCNYTFDAVANIRGGVYFFKGNYFWRITKDGQIFDNIKMPVFWSGFPNVSVDAVYERKHKIFIFSGTNYWEYHGRRLNVSHPRPISDFGLPMEGGIDAAFVWKANEQTYFVKGNQYWGYNEETRKIERNYPRNIRNISKDMPDNIDGAFTDPTDKGGAVYFLKGTKCWRLNERFTLTESTIGEKWFGCPSASGQLGGAHGPLFSLKLLLISCTCSLFGLFPLSLP